jgi:hypothetical protein
LKGDALRFIELEELIPYGHLFHELHFRLAGQTMAYVRSIPNLLVSCSNLRKLDYEGSDDEQNSLFLTQMLQSCPSLEELRLCHVTFNQQEQTAGIFAPANLSCEHEHLRRLTLVCCELSLPILRSVAGIESLKELIVSGCAGLTVAGMTTVATMRLGCLLISPYGRFTVAHLQSFVGSNISQTLHTFNMSTNSDVFAPTDDVQVATALASCHNLKQMSVHFGVGECVFGRNGLDGLQAMATGCPLLAEVYARLTIPGLHFLGTHFPNLEKCVMFNKREAGAPTPEGFPSIAELQTLYPAVTWTS